MKIRLMVVLVVLSLVTIAHAEEVVPYYDSKSSDEMLATVRKTLRRVETMNKKLDTPQPEISVIPIELVKSIEPEKIQTEKSKDKATDFATPILIGLYVVCFMFGGIVFYGIGKSSGHGQAMNEIRISNAQNLWNQYLKSFTGGQTNGR